MKNLILLCLLVCQHVAVSGDCTAGGPCVCTDGKDFRSGQSTDKHGVAISADACCTQCQGATGCLAFAWKAWQNGLSGDCYTIFVTPGDAADADFTSGTIGGPAPNPAPPSPPPNPAPNPPPNPPPFPSPPTPPSPPNPAPNPAPSPPFPPGPPAPAPPGPAPNPNPPPSPPQPPGPPGPHLQGPHHQPRRTNLALVGGVLRTGARYR